MEITPLALQPHPMQRPNMPGEATPAEVRKAAIAFEAAFLTEMLSMTGVGKVPDQFGGGVGEQNFSSFLTRAYAEQIAENRSIGIADRVQQHLMERMR